MPTRSTSTVRAVMEDLPSRSWNSELPRKNRGAFQSLPRDIGRARELSDSNRVASICLHGRRGQLMGSPQRGFNVKKIASDGLQELKPNDAGSDPCSSQDRSPVYMIRTESFENENLRPPPRVDTPTRAKETIEETEFDLDEGGSHAPRRQSGEKATSAGTWRNSGSDSASEPKLEKSLRNSPLCKGTPRAEDGSTPPAPGRLHSGDRTPRKGSGSARSDFGGVNDAPTERPPERSLDRSHCGRQLKISTPPPTDLQSKPTLHTDKVVKGLKNLQTTRSSVIDSILGTSFYREHIDVTGSLELGPDFRTQRGPEPSEAKTGCKMAPVVSIRFLLNLVASSLLLAGCFATAIISFKASDLTIDAAASNLRKSLHGAVKTKIQHTTAEIEQVVAMHVNHFNSGALNIRRSSAILNEFKDTIISSPYLFSLWAVFPQNNTLIGAYYTGNSTFVARSANGTLSIVMTNRQFQPIAGMDPVHMPFDARSGPWHTVAKSNATVPGFWAEPYLWAQQAWVSYTLPIYVNGTFIGVAGGNIHLQTIRDMNWDEQSTKTMGPESISFVVSKEGRLIATSDPNVRCQCPLSYDARSGGCLSQQVVNVTEITDDVSPRMSSAIKYIASTNGWRSFRDLDTVIDINGEDYYLTAGGIRLGQTAWTAVQVVPWRHFFGAVVRSKEITFVAVSGIFAVTLLVTIVSGMIITRPLSRLSRKMRDLFSEEFVQSSSSSRMALQQPSQFREIRDLQQSFDAMKETIRGFELFVPPNVVRQIVLKAPHATNLHVARRRCSILFSDIESFTSIAESIDSQALLCILSTYLDVMTEIVHDTGGVIADIIGDAILAFFNAPDPDPDHVANACHCALDQQKAVKSLNETLTSKRYPSLNIRMGIHVGSVLVGNIGSRLRLKYGVLGDNVNLGSRLEGLNKRYGTRIVASGDVVSDTSAKHTFLYRYLEDVIVKGKQQVTKVFELIGEAATASDLDKERAGWWAAIVAAAAANCDESAFDALGKYEDKFGTDKSTALLRQRMTTNTVGRPTMLTEK